MASPQIENGHFCIASELAEALAKYSPGKAEGQILWAIMRKTYGWHKKEDEISINQLKEATGLSRRAVVYALQNLEAKKMITVKRRKGQDGFKATNIIGIQKNYEKWVVQERGEQYAKALELRKKSYSKKSERVVQEKRGSARNGRGVVQETVIDEPVLALTKYTITKDNITKDNINVAENKFSDDSTEIELSKYLFSLIQDRNPKAKTPNFQAWAKEIDLMLRKDNRTEQEIRAAITWCQNDDFWFANILSTKKLRLKYDALVAAAQRERVCRLPAKTRKSAQAAHDFINDDFSIER
jgi:phage replication O-like protein O